MSETNISTTSPETTLRQRRRRNSIRSLLFLGLCLLLSPLYFWVLSGKQLQSALAEADRLDPGWRINDLEASRRSILDNENSGLVLIAAKQLMPAHWPAWEFTSAPENKELNHELLASLPVVLLDRDPPVRIEPGHLKILRDELRRAAPALAEAHKILDFPRGRYPIQYAKDYISTLLVHTQDSRRFADLFAYEAALHAEEEDMEGALLACRGIVRAEDSVGDEPTLVSMLLRMGTRQLALKKIQQVLALGQPSEPSLAALQHLLEDEEREPLFLNGLRGDRAIMDGLMQAIQNGEVKSGQLPSLLENSGFRAAKGTEIALVAATIRNQRGALLRWYTRAVEIAKLPLEEQKTQFMELEATTKKLPFLARALRTDVVKVSDSWLLDQVSFRCAIALLAVERYRLAQGRWPEKLAELVPTYLGKAPVDVFEGAPLRLRRFSDGVMVYSVGPDGVDNGGRFDNNPRLKGTDWGYRLWDIPRRRQPPRKAGK